MIRLHLPFHFYWVYSLLSMFITSYSDFKATFLLVFLPPTSIYLFQIRKQPFQQIMHSVCHVRSYSEIKGEDEKRHLLFSHYLKFLSDTLNYISKHRSLRDVDLRRAYHCLKHLPLDMVSNGKDWLYK